MSGAPDAALRADPTTITKIEIIMSSTPKTVAGLAALALAAAGFYGGVEVQKHQADGASGGGAGTGPSANAGGPPSATGGAGTAASSSAATTTGTVTSAKDGTLSVKTSDGTTVKVRTTSDATVTRNAETSATQVHPGDTVVVQGKAASNGTVTATRVSASSGS